MSGNVTSSPQVIIDEAANFSLTTGGQPIMFTTTPAGANSAVKAKNNQPNQKMFYPSKDGKQ